MAKASQESIDLLHIGAKEAIQLLGSSLEAGLTHAEVEARLKQYGYNEVPEKKANSLVRFAKKFWGLSAWMLELIIILSWILHKYSDLYIVTALLVVNAILSFAQEQRASGALESLRSRLHVTSRVLRDGVWGLLPARELVPGDIVRLRSGDFVPADVKIVSGEVSVDQSTLTGESMEVEKGPDDVLYSGSIVRRGEGTVIVLLTGARTYYGRTIELVQLARPKLHIEEVISKIVRWLFVVVGVLLAITLVASLLRGIPLLEILPLMLVLLLGAVPVALPVMFTFSLALGSMQLAKKGVLVTRLSALDDAASMDVLCVDKTGTITMNRLALAGVIPLNGFSEQEVILYGAMASQEANQDPIDMAFIAAARQRGLMDRFVQKSFHPFNPNTRRTEAHVEMDGRDLVAMKGAVNIVAQACSLESGMIRNVERRTDSLAQKGYRALAVAVAEGQSQPKLVGLVTLSDVLRPDSAKLIRELKQLGVSVKMLTGDALSIAREIAGAVGLGQNISRAADLAKLASLDAAKAAEIAEHSDGFAEIYPEDKYTVVKVLQAKGHLVGMTGDGVNDAPALRQAEVGIAVSNATDVAKGAASVVLTDDSLASIVDLVKNGRIIYQRIATWIINKISRTILKSAFVVFSFLITGKIIVSAFVMMLMMFLTDFVKISLSTDNARASQEPATWNVIALVKVAAMLGLFMVVEAFGLLYVGFRYFGLAANDQALYTFAFETLFYFAMFSIFVVRERGHFWNSMPSKTLLAAIGLDTMLGTALATIGIPGLHPLPPRITLTVFIYTMVSSLLVNDFIKYLAIRKADIRW
ncbi:MAG: plasma-membrane proton-efflux P-type ATPase [Chloroflexi bacterium]|nr:plasma-membrane proton-efflux P-type ATPase [Chloroflexota bacterium]